MKNLTEINNKAAQQIAELYGKTFVRLTANTENDSVTIYMESDADPSSGQDLTIFSDGVMQWLDQDDLPVLFNTLLAIDFLRANKYYLGPKRVLRLPLTTAEMQYVAALLNRELENPPFDETIVSDDRFKNSLAIMFLKPQHCEKEVLVISRVVAESSATYCFGGTSNGARVTIGESVAGVIYKYLKERGVLS